MAEAMHWVTRITVIGLEMVVLTVAGEWADKRFGTTFLQPTGLVMGLVAAGYHLYCIVQESAAKNPPPRYGRKNGPEYTPPQAPSAESLPEDPNAPKHD